MYTAIAALEGWSIRGEGSEVCVSGKYSRMMASFFTDEYNYINHYFSHVSLPPCHNPDLDQTICAGEFNLILRNERHTHSVWYVCVLLPFIHSPGLTVCEKGE